VISSEPNACNQVWGYFTLYPTVPQYGWDTMFTVPFFFHTVTDFSAGALLISVKFCTVVRPHPGQVFSHFDGDRSRDGRNLGVNRGLYRGICFLLKHLLLFYPDWRRYFHLLCCEI